MAIPSLLSGVPKASHRVPDKMPTRSLRLGAILRVGKKMKSSVIGDVGEGEIPVASRHAEKGKKC
jgi:hypothetical protein